MISHLHLKPGKMAEHHDLFVQMSNHLKQFKPGVIACIKGQDDKDPNVIHTYWVAANTQAHIDCMTDMKKAGSKMETLFKEMGEMRDLTKESKAEIWTDQLAQVKGMFDQAADKPQA